MMNKIKRWEIWGAFLTIIVGSLLHFVYEWSGDNFVVAIFGAVNESTWEHLKMAFWPTFVFASIEYLTWGRGRKNFCFASFIKLFCMPIIIVGLYYGWQAVLPDNVIWDISIFVLAIILGYYLGYKILTSEKAYGYGTLWSVLILAGLVKFSFFTYFPPKLFLFEDPNDSHFGIENKIVEEMDDPLGCLNYEYDACPSGCTKTCEPSVCSSDTDGVKTCTADCTAGICVPLIQ